MLSRPDLTGGGAGPVPLLWVGSCAWADGQDYAIKRQAMAWARAGAPVVYLDPDPGPLQWATNVSAGPDAQTTHTLIWREFMAWWITQAMRSDGPVWVLPWVRRLVTNSGQVWSDPAALVEGLAEWSVTRPVVVAANAGRWTGRSPRVSVVHRPGCLGVPPLGLVPAGWIPYAPGWNEPWAEVALWATPREAGWARMLADCLPEVRVRVLGVTAAQGPSDSWPDHVVLDGDPPPPSTWTAEMVRRWQVLAVSPRHSPNSEAWLHRLLAIHPDLVVVGAVPTSAARVLKAETVSQYVRRLGMRVWLPTRWGDGEPLHGDKWRALAEAACPRCFA